MAPAATWKQKFAHEMIEYMICFVYLGAFLAAFTLYRRLVLAEYQINPPACKTTVILQIAFSSPDQARETTPVPPEKKERQGGDDESHGNTGAIHENVEQDNIYDDRTEEGEPKRHESADQQ